MDKDTEEKRYPSSAENGKTLLGEAGDTLEKAVRDVTEIGHDPDYHKFGELEKDSEDMRRLRRMYEEAEKALNAYG